MTVQNDLLEPRKKSSSLGEKSILMLEDWIATQNKLIEQNEDSDPSGLFANLLNKSGRFDKSKVAKEIGFIRSVFYQNPTVKTLFGEFEDKVIGPAQAHEYKAATDRSEVNSAKLSSKVSKLEEELLQVKAENSVLRRELEKHAAMSEILMESGILRP